MRLVGVNGDAVELTIVGYQFPEIRDDPWDSNWVVIETTATVDGQSWTSRDPCLVTFEVEQLADWVEALGNERLVESELDFMEPNLAFELEGVAGDLVRIRIWFECEARPAWKGKAPVRARDFAACIAVPSKALLDATEDLKLQLAKYPTRVALPR
jgi:hypothetical protein